MNLERSLYHLMVTLSIGNNPARAHHSVVIFAIVRHKDIKVKTLKTVNLSQKIQIYYNYILIS